MSALPIEGELFDDKYRIGPVLGIGGMAAVLAARHLGLDEMVALKVLLPECCDDPAVVERFVQEGKTATKIRSEHVVRMLDVGVASGRAYLVMEYLHGQDLSALLREQGPLPLAAAVDLVLQASEAVGEGHALGIIHRDLKPANLFLTHRVDGTPCLKVLDFGISKMPRSANSASNPTLPSVVMGSPQYMSPEQMMSAAMADQRSDLWSLGAILYELLSGCVAFDGSTTTEVCVHVLQGVPVPLRERRADIPGEVAFIIARCLEKDPANRYANVAELARALVPFGGAGARASADSIGRVVEGATSAAEPKVRAPLRSGPGTMRPTAAEILAQPPSRRRRLSGYVLGPALAALGCLAGAFALHTGPFRSHLAAAAADAQVASAPEAPVVVSPPAPPAATVPRAPAPASPSSGVDRAARSADAPTVSKHHARSAHGATSAPDAGDGDDDPYAATPLPAEPR